MGRILDEPIALMHRFAHQAKFAVLEVADATMHHVRGGGTRSRAKIALIHQQHIHPLQRQVAEGANAVDACANNQN